MGKYYPRIAATCVLAAFIAVAGCGKTDSQKAAADAQALASASPEVKSAWDKVLAASATNDYATAILTCRRLTTNQDLTPDQRAAVSATMSAVMEKMSDAAQKGDAAALQAVQDVRNGWR